MFDAFCSFQENQDKPIVHRETRSTYQQAPCIPATSRCLRSRACRRETSVSSVRSLASGWLCMFAAALAVLTPFLKRTVRFQLGRVTPTRPDLQSRGPPEMLNMFGAQAEQRFGGVTRVCIPDSMLQDLMSRKAGDFFYPPHTSSSFALSLHETKEKTMPIATIQGKIVRSWVRWCGIVWRQWRLSLYVCFYDMILKLEKSVEIEEIQKFQNTLSFTMSYHPFIICIHLTQVFGSSDRAWDDIVLCSKGLVLPNGLSMIAIGVHGASKSQEFPVVLALQEFWVFCFFCGYVLVVVAFLRVFCVFCGCLIAFRTTKTTSHFMTFPAISWNLQVGQIRR